MELNKFLKRLAFLLIILVPVMLFSQSKPFAKSNVFYNSNKLGFAKYQKNFCGNNNICSYVIKDNEGGIQIIVQFKNGWFIAPKTREDSLASVDFTEIIFINTLQKTQVLGINKSESFLAKMLAPFFGYQYTKYGGSFYLIQDSIDDFIKKNRIKYTNTLKN